MSSQLQQDFAGQLHSIALIMDTINSEKLCFFAQVETLTLISKPFVRLVGGEDQNRNAGK